MDNNLGSFLPWWLLATPLVLAVFDWMRTPKSNTDRHHSSMGHAGTMGTMGTADAVRR